jgi:CDP-glucose 4,6-dehydratase
MSKAAAELVVASWHASFFSRDPHLGPLATARGGNAIGGGDYGEDRLVPDLVRSAIRGVPMLLRRPHATRPWQHVLELVAGYLALGQRLLTRADTACVLSYNFGPGPEAEKSVRDLVDSWLREWPDSLCVDVASQPAYAEADGISLDASRAKAELGWKPVWTFYDAVRETSRWYQARHHGGAGPAAMLRLSREQIHQYTAHARSQSVGWAGS